MRRPRPWLAATLALFHPGLGHAYLREWARAGVWFLLALLAVLLVVPEAAMESIELSDPATILGAVDTVGDEITTVGIATIGFVVGINVADAYSLAQRDAMEWAREAGDSAVPCPHCGKDLDEDLDFCHWCTTRLGDEEEDDAVAP